MFNKVRKTWLNATDSFTVEMLRAILKYMIELGIEAPTEVYLTQSLIKARKPRPHTPNDSTNQYANSVLEVAIEGFFTLVDFPRRHGHEGPRSSGALPLLPSYKAKFVFTNEANGWFNWNLWRVEVSMKDCYPPMMNLEYGVTFDGSAPLQLKRLSDELQHRGPSRFRENE